MEIASEIYAAAPRSVDHRSRDGSGKTLGCNGIVILYCRAQSVGSNGSVILYCSELTVNKVVLWCHTVVSTPIMKQYPVQW